MFTPNTELIEFARNFSDNYKLLSEGKYSSQQNNYCIDYLWGFALNEDNKSTVTFRTLSNGKIEANKQLIYKNPKITSDFVFFMIVWCVSFHEDKRAYETVDADIIKYCSALEWIDLDKLQMGFSEVMYIAYGGNMTSRMIRFSKSILDIRNENENKSN